MPRMSVYVRECIDFHKLWHGVLRSASGDRNCGNCIREARSRQRVKTTTCQSKCEPAIESVSCRRCINCCHTERRDVSRFDISASDIDATRPEFENYIADARVEERLDRFFWREMLGRFNFQMP